MTNEEGVVAPLQAAEAATGGREARNDELETYRIPVTVFVSVRGVDFGDAAAIAEVTIRRTLHAAGTGGDKRTLQLEHRRLGTLETYVHKVMEAGMAAGNGYLWTEATSKAFREHPETARCTAMRGQNQHDRCTHPAGHTEFVRTVLHVDEAGIAFSDPVGYVDEEGSPVGSGQPEAAPDGSGGA